MSKKTTQTINVDLLKPQIITLHAKQYDTLSRECKFRLLAGGAPFTIDGGVTVAVQYAKPDGTHGFYDTMPDGGAAATVTTENGGTVLTLLFAPQVLTAAGDVQCSVSMYYTGSSEKLQSFSVTIKVEAAETDGTGSADYYNMHTLDELNTAIENSVKVTAQSFTEAQKAWARTNIGAVPTGRTVNGKPLTADVNLNADDVGAMPSTRTINDKPLTNDVTLDAADIPALVIVQGVQRTDVDAALVALANIEIVSPTRKVNGKPLSADVVLNASDVGAATEAYVNAAIGDAIGGAY